MFLLAGDSNHGAYAFVMQVAHAQRTYFGALQDMAHAVQTFLDNRDQCVPTLAAAARTLVAAELTPVLRGDVYESELRSHRFTLEAMVAQAGTPSVHVDEGRVFYCYPFAVHHLDSAEVAKRLLAIPRGARLGRCRVIDADELDVTDAWDNSDPEGRSYGGVKLTLDDLSILTTAGVTLPPHHVEVRATTIGTCYVRICAQLQDASVHALNQTMRRGSVHMGQELISQGEQRWSRLSDFASEVIGAIETTLARGGTSVRAVANPERRQHTIVSIRKISLVGSDGSHRAAHYEDVQHALGGRLFEQRINHASATLEEYVRAHTTVRERSFATSPSKARSSSATRTPRSWSCRRRPTSRSSSTRTWRSSARPCRSSWTSGQPPSPISVAT
jgi:hypothetical protein